ncbi:M23 family metallopeptidase [Nocardioides sp.]|uniref:M23 family metallopeptidase n=1 Tax=Nocardioides sp. TaxID=35761 RepID=UPI003566E39E
MRLLIASLTLVAAGLPAPAPAVVPAVAPAVVPAWGGAAHAEPHHVPREEPRTSPAGTWPLRPRPVVAQRFAAPDSPWGSGHRGVDLNGVVGQAVRAALPGRVGFVGAIAGRGVVVVQHGATRTTYEPVEAEVRVGERVAAGAVLGKLALGGSHCFPVTCLHWGWLRGATYLDPLLLVDAGPVRLLPLAARGRSTASQVPLRRATRPALPYDAWWRQARGCACW